MHSLALISRSDEKLNASRLADITLFSRNHLAKVLHLLVKHNYLSSLRGPNGGFELKTEAKEISLLEIYELIEGELDSFQCAVTCTDCYFDECLFGNFPHKFSGEFKTYLEGKNVSDFKVNRNLNS